MEKVRKDGNLKLIGSQFKIFIDYIPAKNGDKYGVHWLFDA